MSTGNKTTVSFDIAPGKKRKLTEKSQLIGDWPQNLKDYAKAAFEHCQPGQQSKLEKELKTLIKRYGVTADWEQLRLPKSAGHIPNPNGAITSIEFSASGNDQSHANEKTGMNTKPRGKLQSSRKQNQQGIKGKGKVINTSMGPPPKSTGGIIEADLTPEELNKREMRKLRFQNIQPAKRTSISSVSAALPSGKSQSSSASGDLVKDRETCRIVGLCTNVEKPYLRLTSAPDPFTVRTPETLKKAFDMLNQKWKLGSDYSYICDQFKSLRQDLTVQHIVDEFTVKVYEAHGRIALEMGDLGEYNQCQSQLMHMYKKGIKGCHGEFVAYQILYMLFSENYSELNGLMEKLDEAHTEGRNMGKFSKSVKHAMSVRMALAHGDYHNFFKLYHVAPNRSRFLMDKFMDRERTQALKVLCKAFPMGLPFAFIVKELAFYSTDDFVTFLSRHGVTSVENDICLNTKAALPRLIEYSRKYQKVDIKGQM